MYPANSVSISTGFNDEENDILNPKKTPGTRRLGQEGWCKQTQRRRVNSSREY
jgi:hypothetical protein